MRSVTHLFTPAGDLAGDEDAPADDALTGVFAAGISSPLAFLPPSDSELGARWRFRPFPLLAEGPTVKMTLFAGALSIIYCPEWSCKVLFSLPLYLMILYGLYAVLEGHVYRDE